MKVLVIDDNNDNLVSLTAMLRNFLPGCQTLTALSGREGIDKARTFGPDTILLDIQMPDMDGFQVCRALKTDPATCHIPVIFLTAQSTNPSSRIHGLEIGGDAFLAKPVEPGELMAQVRAMVRIKQAEDVLRGEKHSLERGVAERTAALTASKNRYHGLFESMLNGFALHEVICDAAGRPVDYRFLDVNPAFERLTGLVANNIVGRTVLEVMPNLERRWIDAYGQVALTGKSARFDDHSQDLGRWYHVLAYCPAHRQFACVFEDITEKKQLEAQLLQAQKMQAIGQLAGGVAHNFRNQLTVIKGYGEMLLRESFSPQQARPMMEEMLRAADRATDVASHLLSFSRKDMLVSRAINLAPLVAELTGRLGQLVGEDIRISIVGAERDCPVKIAADQFEQAMMNLAANARDAMPGGGPLTIEIAGVELDESSAGRPPDAQPGPYARVSITDSGNGMSKETMARLFEPFFTTKEVGQGTGLGLPMVYGFVAQSGGFINVWSEPGKGSTFELYFPRTDGIPGAEPAPTMRVTKLEDTPQHPSRKQDASGPKLDRGSATILVVEDEESIRQLLTLNLQEAGYTVLQTDDAREALRLATSPQHSVDLLITDVIMPGLNGMDLARQVRIQRPGLPAMFVSGYGGEDLSRRGIDLKGAELLVKPFQFDELIGAVRRVLQARIEAASPRPPQ